MKKTKKVLALLMAILLSLSVCVVPSIAEEVYPESSHPYENNANEFYYYEYSDKSVENLFVTFSEETSFEDYSWAVKYPDKNWTVADYLEKYKTGDQLIIYDDYREIENVGKLVDFFMRYYMSQAYLTAYDEANDVLSGYFGKHSYSGSSLSGKTVVAVGYKIALNLRSDDDKTDYGFSIDRISDELPDNLNYVHYNLADNSYYDFTYLGEDVRVNPKGITKNYTDPNFVIVGWATEPNGEAVYKVTGDKFTNEGTNLELYPVWERAAYSVTFVVDDDYVQTFSLNEDIYVSPFMAMGSYYYKQIANLILGWTTDPDGNEIEITEGQQLEGGKDYVLYPVWRETILKREEVFSFDHTDDNFPNGYRPREDHYKTMMLNAAKAFGINPLTVLPGAIMLGVNEYIMEQDWCGSCYGLAATVCLQHLGEIDLLSSQGAENVRALEPDEELISIVNNYQNMSLQSTVGEEWVITPGTEMYRQHVKRMYDSVSNGNLALFTYASNPGSLMDVIKNYADAGHCVVGIGTYELPEEKQFDGFTHAMFVYDCNYEFFQTAYIKDDFSEIYYERNYDGDGAIGIFKWTDDFTVFKSFNLEGNADPTAVQVSMVKRLVLFITMLLGVLAKKVFAK